MDKLQIFIKPNYSSADTKLSKTQIANMVHSGGFLGILLGPLLKTGLSLMKNIIKSLAKSFFNSIRIN